MTYNVIKYILYVTYIYNTSILVIVIFLEILHVDPSFIFMI